MFRTFFDRWVNQLIHAQIAHPDSVLGCTQEQIAEIAADQGVSLPAVYRQFLERAGRSAGTLFRGSEVLYPDLIGNRDIAQELLRFNNVAWELPMDAFVFFVHQGYQFTFFRASDGDDPPCYHYTKLAGAPERSFEHFTEFLTRYVDDTIRLRYR